MTTGWLAPHTPDSTCAMARYTVSLLRTAVVAIATCPIAHAQNQDGFAGAGIVEGRTRTVSLAFLRSGVIHEMSVDPGQKVVAGQPLARLHCPVEEAQIQSAASLVKEAEQNFAKVSEPALPVDIELATARLRSAQAERKKRMNAADRLKRLNTTANFASAAAIEDAESDLDSAIANEKMAESQLARLRVGATPAERELARARVAAAQSELAAARAKHSLCVLRAPHNGVLLGWEVPVGAEVPEAGGRPVGYLADVSSFRVRAEFDEEVAGRLSAGTAVMVGLPDAAGAKARGKLAVVRQIVTRRAIASHDALARTGRGVIEVIVNLEQCTPAICVIGRRVLVTGSSVSARH
jgi:multidrug resistance efflux pump